MIRRYWGRERFYHHTAPVSMMYALAEALRLVAEEGLEARWRRHETVSAALQAGLEAMGLRLFVRKHLRLTPLVAVEVPPGVDDTRLRRELLTDYGIEIGGGLGRLKGRIVRIGVMGHSAQKRNVMLLLAAMEDCLDRQGFRVPFGEAEQAALSVYRAGGASGEE
jgi:alanine-glyoxylate transaminase/serine-glyoxylate transaminase/serine-pyruvate transaminase